MRFYNERTWKKRKLKPIKQPSKYYPFPQSDGGFDITINFTDLANDLRPYFNDPRPFHKGDGEAELGPAYAFCENFIRFGVMQRGERKATVPKLLKRLMKEFPNIENFDVVRVANIIKKYNKKYGNGKWKKNPIYKKSLKHWEKLLGRDMTNDYSN